MQGNLRMGLLMTYGPDLLEPGTVAAGFAASVGDEHYRTATNEADAIAMALESWIDDQPEEYVATVEVDILADCVWCTGVSTDPADPEYGDCHCGSSHHSYEDAWSLLSRVRQYTKTVDVRHMHEPEDYE